MMKGHAEKRVILEDLPKRTMLLKASLSFAKTGSKRPDELHVCSCADPGPHRRVATIDKRQHIGEGRGVPTKLVEPLNRASPGRQSIPDSCSSRSGETRIAAFLGLGKEARQRLRGKPVCNATARWMSRRSGKSYRKAQNRIFSPW